MKRSLFFLLLFLSPPGIFSQTNPGIKMADFIGINSNVAAYDYKYLPKLALCAKWIREYHNWAQYEAANNYYKWDNITTEPHGYTWPEHTEYMKECQKLGLNVLVDVLGKPSWAGTSPIPTTSGTGSNVSEYLERLEFIGQLVARYGSKKISTSLLETADKATGLNMVTYYEDDNEPDYNWQTPQWAAINYAKYCNAAHDGYGVQTNTDYPLLGIKSVDPDAKHVMAGLAFSDTVYLNTVLKASGNRVPFDVLNMHWYCSDHTNAYSPENEKYGYEIFYHNFFKWKSRNLPNIPVWMTEFGWDTYLAPDNKHSYTYAPVLQQANYILRSYLVLLKAGFEKAFLFMDADTDSKNILQYSASGLLSDKNSMYSRKPSFFYLATMQNILGQSAFIKAIDYKTVSGNNEIYCLEFSNHERTEKVFAAWTRRSNSNTDEGAKTTYQLKPGYKPNYAYSILPVDSDLDGDTIRYTITEPAIELNLTETPQFVVISENNTSSQIAPEKQFELKIFPNPAKAETLISLSLPSRQKINISAYNPEGRLVTTFSDGTLEQGIHQYTFGPGQLPGTYSISANNAIQKSVQKLILLK